MNEGPVRKQLRRIVAISEKTPKTAGAKTERTYTVGVKSVSRFDEKFWKRTECETWAIELIFFTFKNLFFL